MKIKYTLTALLVYTLGSCSSETKEDMILGTWSPQGPYIEKGQKVEFLKNNIAVSKRLNSKPEAGDTIKYKFSEDGKKLITTETDGRIDELEIVTLTKTDMALLIKGSSDTFRLKKDK